MDSAERRYLDGFSAGSRVRLTHGATLRVPATALPLPAVAPPAAATFEEQVKRELHPLDAFPRLLACAEANLPPSPADRFRFQWFGLSYLAPEKDGFRLRLRVPGGILRTFQVREAAEMARECASGSMKINRHAGLDLETVALPDAPEALRRAELAGLSFRGTGGDQVVAVLGHPMTGLDADELIDVSPLVTRLEQCLLLEREFADLPHSCVITFDGSGGIHAHDLPAGDIRLVAHKMAGEAGGNPEIGFRLEVADLGDLETSLRPEQSIHACLELLRLYLREANRTDRDHTPLRAFYRTWSKARCLETLEALLGTRLPRCQLTEAGSQTSLSGKPLTDEPKARRCEVSVWPQRKSGLLVVDVTAPADPWLSAQWDHIAHLADLLGCGRVRLTGRGTLLFPGVLPANSLTLQEELRKLIGGSARPSR